MKLKWLGTAGFQIEAGDQVLLVDPYLSRNQQAEPVQPVQPQDLPRSGPIFITHGHFDHIYDVPSIAALGEHSIYCSEIASATLVQAGVDSSRINVVKDDGYTADFGGCRAQAFFSRHVKFDLPLVARTLWRIGPGYRRFSGLNRSYPKGQVFSWRFTIEGKTVHHFGSAGSGSEELERLADQSPDLLLVPLQGHTYICDIALEYVRVLKPRMVIPHHQDDFYPPISTYVDIAPFVQAVKKHCPGTEVRVMAINETITF